MSKYNNIKTIPIEDISADEIEQAMIEWAEGSEGLYNLLKTLYNENIETAGCHVGRFSYIDIVPDDSYSKINNLLNYIEKVNNSRVIFNYDGNNPNSGKTFYVESITFVFYCNNKEEAEKIFNGMTNAVKKEETKCDLVSTLKFFELLRKQESNLEGAFLVKNNTYTFRITSTGTYRNEEYAKLFDKLGLEIKKDDDSARTIWEISNSSFEDFIKELNNLYDKFEQLWNFERTDEITDELPANLIALKKRREFDKFENADDLFSEWFENNLKDHYFTFK